MISEKIYIEKINEVNIKIYASDGVSQELFHFFTFKPEGYQYSPLFRKKDANGRRAWDGTIRLFQIRSGMILAGLRQEIEKFCSERGYEVLHLSDFSEQEFSIKEGVDFIRTLNLPANRNPHDYQVEAFVKCVRQKRRLTLLSTGSGKSLILYILSCYYAKMKKLIIVPTLVLIHQMVDDFISYGCDPSRIHKIYSGQEKETDCDIVISTWQSLGNLPKEFFKQFSVVLGDEAHLFSAKTLNSIMGKLSHVQYRLGFSGTLDGKQCNEFTLTGIFGPIRRSITTKELMDRGTLANLEIKMIVLKHPEEDSERLVHAEYFDEIEYIIGCERRNKFIRNLALSLKGNTLCLFQFVEKHGKIIYDLINAGAEEGRKIFFVYGGIPGEERNAIRAIVETEKNAIIVASRKTFGTGLNIQNIHNVIFASPLKAKIANLQAIGRGLRKSETKEKVVLFDIVDDLMNNNRKNHTLRHAEVRLNIYDEEQFSYKLYDINMEKG